MARLSLAGPRRLRDRAYAVALVVAATPFLVLISMNRWELHRGELTAEGCQRTLERAKAAPWAEATPEPGQRLRVIKTEGITLLDVDRSLEASWEREAGDFFYGPAAPGLVDADMDFGPLVTRPESVRSDGPKVSSRYASGANLVVWSAAQWHEGVLLHVQGFSRRTSVAQVIASRQIVKVVSMAIALAVAAAWFLSRRLVEPLTRLRREVLARATDAVPKAGIDLGRRDEVGEVAEAFNTLLEALASRTRTNEAFLTDLAHELKNPVAAIRTCADVLSGGDLSQERVAKLTEVLRYSTTQLDGLVTQFLELARAEAGLPNEERQRIDLAALLNGLCSTFRDDPRFQGVTFRLKNLESPCFVQGVAVRLERAFSNLLLNALSFAGPAGWVQVALTATGEHGVVTIRDSGPGVPAELLPRLFERFFTTRRESTGTGLGLAMTRAIVEAHSGQITASSPEGSGACFEVRLMLSRDFHTSGDVIS
jgi:signal transduction histidine kinase